MKRNAFTIVELLLTISVFGIIAAMLISNLRYNREMQNLRAASRELVSKIRYAQSLASQSATQRVCTTDGLLCGSGSCCEGVCGMGACQYKPLSIFGIQFSPSGNTSQYVIFADNGTGTGGAYAAGEAIPNGIITLPSNIVIQSVTPNQPIVFNALNPPFNQCTTCSVVVTLRNSFASTDSSITFYPATGLISTTTAAYAQ